MGTVWPDRPRREGQTERSDEMEISPLPERPKQYEGTTTRYKTACGWLYVTVNTDDQGNPMEVFAKMGKVGGCGSIFLESIGRTLSVALRSGVDPVELTEQFIGLGCPSRSVDDGVVIFSCAHAIGLALTKVLEDRDANTVE